MRPQRGQRARIARLTIVEADEELDGNYRLDATIAVAQGTARANITAADGEQVGGEVTPEAPLQITAVIESGDEEENDVGPEGRR